jgi:hypothetical protein
MGATSDGFFFEISGGPPYSNHRKENVWFFEAFLCDSAEGKERLLLHLPCKDGGTADRLQPLATKVKFALPKLRLLLWGMPSRWRWRMQVYCALFNVCWDNWVARSYFMSAWRVFWVACTSLSVWRMWPVWCRLAATLHIWREWLAFGEGPVEILLNGQHNYSERWTLKKAATAIYIKLSTTTHL